jgi:hypothetical protein
VSLRPPHFQYRSSSFDGKGKAAMSERSTQRFIGLDVHRRCCVGVCSNMPDLGRLPAARSEGQGKVVERDADSILDRHVNSDGIVAAAQVLHERVPGRDSAC